MEDDGSDESVSETTVLLPRSQTPQPQAVATPRSGGDYDGTRRAPGSTATSAASTPVIRSLDSADGGTQGGRDDDATEALYDSPGDAV